MNSTAECVWCDNHCYDQTVFNGTGACDRYAGRNAQYFFWYRIQVPQAVVGLLGHVILGRSLWKNFKNSRSIMLVGGQLIADFFFCLYITLVNGLDWIRVDWLTQSELRRIEVN